MSESNSQFLIHNKQHFLVTGGAGFIGSHLCEKLIKLGNKVTCLDDFSTGKKDNLTHLLDNPHFHLIQHDVVFPLNTEQKFDGIFHLACPASPVSYQTDPIQTTKTAVLGTLNILELAKNADIPVLVTSTSEVYGDPKIHPQTEKYFGNVNPLGKRACYDEGKRCAESLCMDFNRQYGVHSKIVRLFNTYGPNMDSADGRVVPNFIKQALKNDSLTIYGNGMQIRSFCYVGDTINGILECAKSLEEGPINIGNPEEITILEFSERVIALTQSQSKIEYKPLPDDDPCLRCPDITLAKKTLNWQPTTTLNDGLKKTIQYFKQKL